jgi:hypothetical protein
MILRLFQFSSIAVLLLASQILQAQGILMVEQETRDGKSTTNEIQLDKNHMRAESHNTGDDMAVVFDGGAQVIRMINLDKKTYNEIDKAQLDQLRQRMGGASAQMSAAQQKMQEQMKNMTPEQRAMVEQMMRGRGMTGMPPGPAAAKTEFRPAGSDKVGKWSCNKYEGFRGQEKVSEVCTVDPKDLGLTVSDFDVAKQLAEFLKTIAPQSADRATYFGTAEDQGFSGVPVRRISYVNGKVSSESELKDVRHEAFPASTFDVPAGFTKQAMPGMGPRP